jgi:antitoxin YefM
MKTITYTAAREGLAATMDQVCRDRDPVTITRNRDQAVVMMSLDDYEELEETAHLLRSPKRGQFLILSTPRPASSGNTRDGSDNRMCPSSDARLIHPTVIVVSARKPAAKATFTEFPFGSLRLIRDRRR